MIYNDFVCFSIVFRVFSCESWRRAGNVGTHLGTSAGWAKWPLDMGGEMLPCIPRLSVGKVVAMSMCLLLVEFEFTRRRQPRSKLWKMRMLPSRTMKHWPKRPLQVWQQKRKRHESEIPTSTNIHHSAQEFDPSQHDLLNRLCWGWQCGGSHHQSRGATSQHLSILFDRVWRSYDLIYGYLSRLVNDRSMTLAS